jgi:hypothetical protein
MDADKYVNILKTNFIGKYEDDLYFQFDNDPKHTSIKALGLKALGLKALGLKAKNFITKNKIKIINHPPSSPDLNPIENIWGIMKKKISKFHYDNNEQFIKSILEEWNNIDKQIIENTILSMKKRLQLVINNKGDHIDY